MPFTPPGREQRLEAIGLPAGLPEQVQRAFLPDDNFMPLPVPGPHDWLSNHPEGGQTYEEFLRSHPNKPDWQRHTIYLQPLGEFAPGESPSLNLLQQFATAFFSMPVTVLPALNLARGTLTSRKNPYSGQTQLLTTGILSLLSRELPGDAFAPLGITMIDLYPDPAWNFVFGQASLRQRVGVYSFARYNPRFFDETPAGSPEELSRLMLRRSCKVLAHETSHMFGIAH